MGTDDGVVEIGYLERHLLSENPHSGNCEIEDGTVLYEASFQDMEDSYVKYQTARWVLYSLLLVLAWGIGIIMFLYLPVRRHILRKDFRSRKLQVTPDAIVYKVARPLPIPWFGMLKKEKHVLLASVSDIAIEQGYLQSYFGMYSVRIEHAGVRRPASDDVQIQGISHPWAFRKAVLTRVSDIKSASFYRQFSPNEDLPSTTGVNYSPAALPNTAASLSSQLLSPSRYIKGDASELLLQKLEEVGSFTKRIESLIAEKQVQNQSL
ncbi:hypothetical protein H6P81_015007 [Aristolochia fimbriata]|uniref:DUF7642 domain-containing protein n=1 Tax=Aristolochia fimbriata TaxID=158543 RepID=A0AAV7E847_ARIFI|nr:hypothetical protein H6P81_015007 [Aristolochia fimbriata]